MHSGHGNSRGDSWDCAPKGPTLHPSSESLPTFLRGRGHNRKAGRFWNKILSIRPIFCQQYRSSLVYCYDALMILCAATIRPCAHPSVRPSVKYQVNSPIHSPPSRALCLHTSIFFWAKGSSVLKGPSFSPPLWSTCCFRPDLAVRRDSVCCAPLSFRCQGECPERASCLVTGCKIGVYGVEFLWGRYFCSGNFSFAREVCAVWGEGEFWSGRCARQIPSLNVVTRCVGFHAAAPVAPLLCCFPRLCRRHPPPPPRSR